MKKYSIKFTDGQILKDLEFRGINFVSSIEIDESIFKDNLKDVAISD